MAELGILALIWLCLTIGTIEYLLPFIIIGAIVLLIVAIF